MTKNELAIKGGEALLHDAQPHWPTASRAIREVVSTALEDGTWGKYESRWSTILLEKLQQHFQCEHILPCCSGTIAVELALRGVGAAAGDEVIMAGYDFPGNFRAIESIGAFPVLCDVVAGGWVIDAQQIEQAISPTTSAIIVSHLHGQIADMQTIRRLVEDWNQRRDKKIWIIEDACQTPGGSIGGQPLGSFGDVATLSFGGSKLLSAGRGGAVITHSPEILQRARIYNSRGNEAFPLSQLQAAVLGPQLDELNELTALRNRNALRLIEATRDFETMLGLRQIVCSPESANEDSLIPAFYKLPWLLKDRTTGWSRGEFIAAIQAEGVNIDAGFRGFLRRSSRRCRRTGVLANSQVAAQQTLLLHHPMLLASDDTIDLVVAAIRKVATASP